MQHKHTQGEWIVRRSVPQEGDNIHIKTDKILSIGVGDLVGDTDSYMAVAFAGKVYNEEAEANARLIAAAPDLLEALEYMVNCNTIDRFKCELPDALNKAKAAIEKATNPIK